MYFKYISAVEVVGEAQSNYFFVEVFKYFSGLQIHVEDTLCTMYSIYAGNFKTEEKNGQIACKFRAL